MNLKPEYTDLNELLVGSITTYASFSGVQNKPSKLSSGTVLTFNYKNSEKIGTVQIVFDPNYKGLEFRMYWGGSDNYGWGKWNYFYTSSTIDSLLEQVNQETSFEIYDDKVSNAIYDVKYISQSNTRYGISNIRNKYNGSEYGIIIFYLNEDNTAIDALKVAKSITLTAESLKGEISTKVNDDIFYFKYDLTVIPEGSRLAGGGKNHIVSKYCNVYNLMKLFELNVLDIVNSNSYKDYSGLSMFEKFAVIGDSYASGECYVLKPDGTYSGKDYYNLSWGQNIARMCGNTCVNLSKGGLITRSWLTDSKGLSLLQSYEEQQLYMIVLGLNDVGKLGTSYIGTINDITDDFNNNPDTFFGNYGKIIENCKLKSPNCKFILSTMAGTSGTTAAFNTAIIEIADYYKIPVIKQYEDDFFTSAFYNNYRTQGHPTAPVYTGMAKAIMRLCNKCMQDNIEYFMDYIG